MNSAGVLLDTGPLVALLSKHDAAHSKAQRAFSECLAPFRCCEAVVTEACFLMRKVHSRGPAEVIALAQRGLFQMSISLENEWTAIESLLAKYASRSISLADACLIRCADIYQEPRILTFDSDFEVYRWSRTKKFQIL
jgi:predicted nucleic acid-binding protein